MLAIGVTMLLNSPKVQQRVAVALAAELENRIGTRVELGNVHWLFPNDIVIDSLAIDDQEGNRMLAVDRIAAKVEWMPLIKQRQISVRNIRLFAPDINVYRETAEGDMNYQFLIDAFATKQHKEKKTASRLNLRVNSLLIRRAHIRYDVHSAQETPGQFNPQHIDVNDLSTVLSLKTLTADSISVMVRSMQFAEQSGLQLDDLYLRLVGNHQGATLVNFRLDMPHSALRLDTVWMSYSADDFTNSLIVKGAVLPSHVTLSDVGSLIPAVKEMDESIHFSAEGIGSASRINIKSLALYTHQRDLTLQAHGMAQWGQSLDLNLEMLGVTSRCWDLIAEQIPSLYASIPTEVTRIGAIAASGTAHIGRADSHIKLMAHTDAGDIEANATIDAKGAYQASVYGTQVDVARIVPASPLATTHIALHTEGVYDHKAANDTLPLRGTFEGTVTQAEVMGYTYQRLALSGSYAHNLYEAVATLDDPNGHLALQATYNHTRRIPTYTLHLKADSLDLNAMNLIDIHEGNSFSAMLHTHIRGADLDQMTGEIAIDSLVMHRPTGDDYLIREIDLYSTDPTPEHKMLSLHTDFMDGSLSGSFTYQSLANSILAQLHHYLPSFCYSHQHDHVVAHKNICTGSLRIYDTRPLRELLLIPIDISKTASVETVINDHTETFYVSLDVPNLNYDGNAIKGINLSCQPQGEQLVVMLGGTFQSNPTTAVTANLTAHAHDDNVWLGATWNSNAAGLFEGTFNTQARFGRTDRGEYVINIASDSSQAVINKSEWTLEPFMLSIEPDRINIEDLHFAHDANQYLSVDGTIAHSNADTLQVKLNNLDLGYLLSLVNLKGISFGGNVSGYLNAASLYTAEPYLDGRLTAQDFSFCGGPMGDMQAQLQWNQDSTCLEFVALLNETPDHTTVVDGTVDLAHDELWLDIAADSVNVSFLNTMLGSFMNDIQGNATGHITIGGPMDAIDLDGALMGDIGFDLTPTNVRYHLNDTIRFSEGVISLDGIEALDDRGQKAIVAGRITHNKLSDYAYDLYIDVQNILGIDLPDTGNDSFYTTIYGTGDVHVSGSPTTPLTIGIQAQPERGSLFALNIANESVSSSDAFITFTDRSKKRNTATIDVRPQTSRIRASTETSSLNLDIIAHITPDATLKLVMNQAVDDHISATGNGDLQISIRGDDINLFGTYTVNRGFYRLSLQEVINKSFDVLDGSTVTFDGDPMNARLNITARHVVNYVPLKDLSPELTGNVHVNCLLHIGGTLNAPDLTFDLELPQGTEEEKAILRSYTSTEEQKNMQFIYLLGLGKFYTLDMAQAAEGTDNVESFLSTTISGQINNLLSNIISSSNWNFASNIRTENMLTGENDMGGDNWENMEIEGILEGRLLDNRLLINGNFGYRENPMYASNFIGDFDVRYLLANGVSLKGYNKTNDRYFSKTSLTTQGVGLMLQRDFDYLIPRYRKRKAQPADTTMTVVTDSVR